MSSEESPAIKAFVDYLYKAWYPCNYLEPPDDNKQSKTEPTPDDGPEINTAFPRWSLEGIKTAVKKYRAEELPFNVNAYIATVDDAINALSPEHVSRFATSIELLWEGKHYYTKPRNFMEEPVLHYLEKVKGCEVPRKILPEEDALFGCLLLDTAMRIEAN